jgi:alpha-tubulin suppressor-like RCC1 family protein
MKCSSRGWVWGLCLSAGCTYPQIDLGRLPDANGSTDGAPPQQSVRIAQVAAGWYHTCALTVGGQVYCWGNNYGGMLGDGTQTDHLQPALVQGLGGPVISIDADYTDSCAVLADGRKECWGSNNYGQLGDGTTITRALPVDTILDPAMQLSLGEYHSCGALPDGTVQCWGDTTGGAAGLPVDQTATPTVTPTPVPGVSTAKVVSAGAGMTCALLEDSTVSCWGMAGTGDQVSGPTVIVGVTHVKQVSVGSVHVCVLHADTTVSCWGANYEGQVGAPAVVPSWNGADFCSPARVAGLAGVVQVASGDGHTCALLTTGQVECWGRNTAGQLGDGTTVGHFEPAMVVGIDNAVQISAGFNQTCAVLKNGALECWGNLFQLGDDSHPPPQPVPAIVNF